MTTRSLHSSEGPDEGYDQEKPQPVNAPVPFEKTAVDKPVLKRCPDRRCKVTVHTWTWLTDDGEPTGPTYICRPGAPS